MVTIECPNCKEEVSQVEIECLNCGFPLGGTEKEKAIFFGRQIANKSKIGDAKESQNKSQKILYIIGAFQLLNAFIVYNNGLIEDFIFYMILAILLLVFGYFSSKKPLLFLSLVFIMFYYLLLYLADPLFFFQGIIWKLVTIMFLGYGIINTIKEISLKKKYNYLNK